MERHKIRLSLFLLLAVQAGTAFGVTAVPLNSKIYIEPQGGFESYLAAAVVKKHVPVVVITNKADAAYVLTSVVEGKEESTGSKIVRCLFVYCIGMEGTQTSTVQLVNARTKEIVWAYSVRKLGAKNYQSSAEAIAKHLKEFISKPLN